MVTKESKKRPGRPRRVQTAPAPLLLRKESRLLSVKLSDEELRQAGNELAMTCQEIDAEEARQKNVKDQLKARLSELDARKSKLAMKIAQKEELREVPVLVELRASGEVSETRKDTGEILTIRPARDYEQQLPLDKKKEETIPEPSPPVIEPEPGMVPTGFSDHAEPVVPSAEELTAEAKAEVAAAKQKRLETETFHTMIECPCLGAGQKIQIEFKYNKEGIGDADPKQYPKHWKGNCPHCKAVHIIENQHWDGMVGL